MSNRDTERQIKPFAAVLQEIGKGAAHTRLSEALADLTVAVTETQKKGTLTLTLTVEPTKGMENLTVSANCKVTLPTEQQASIFFATDEGQLVRHDPRQTEVPLHEVGTARRGENRRRWPMRGTPAGVS